MKRKNLLLLVIFVLGAGSIISLSVSNVPLLQPKREPIELSVIVRQSDSITWSAARLGMEQAAGDYGVELRFLTLAQANSAQEQRDLLQREIEGGADGIILAPADANELAEEVRQASESTTLLTLETDMSDSGAVACITTDNAALGTALGMAALNGTLPEEQVLLLQNAQLSTGIAKRVQAAAAELQAQGRRVVYGRSDVLGELLEQQPCRAVIAFEPSVLEEAAAVIGELAKEQQPLLYGVGGTAAIAAALEQGIITTTAAQNEFALGYLAVEEAVRSVDKKPPVSHPPLEFTMVRQENMYSMENQKLLFPVL